LRSSRGWVALFLAAYTLYTWREMRREDEVGAEEVELEPLKFRPKEAAPSTSWAVFQTVLALVVIFVSSQVFVRQLEAVGPWLGLSPQLVALLLSPIATELPETLNAVIWVRQGKESLALGNISGAMMIQATVPSALGLMFTPWLLDRALVWAAVVTVLSIVGMLALLKRHALTNRRLALFGLLYLIFGAGLFVTGV
jgi:cation:H+ antiporter